MVDDASMSDECKTGSSSATAQLSRINLVTREDQPLLLIFLLALHKVHE
jgi:hypothetical protein